VRRNINGILLLDKPTNMTSNGALQRVKRLFTAKKAGHTGSLDPIATGMLPLCFGEATKFSQYLLDSDKTYYVTAKLGVTTTTGDSEGSVVATTPVENVTAERISNVMQRFIGDSQQIPPMFSAIKHEGKPLYELARKGIEIERKPRAIHIFSLVLDAINGDEMTFTVHCSKGTYVRTLVEDICRELDCGAHVIALRRVYVSPYRHISMVTLAELEAMAQNNGFQQLTSCLLPVESSVEAYPAITLSTASAFYMRTGQPVRANFPSGATLVRLLAEDGKFIGMGEVMSDGRVKPHRLVA
jgi:tRNA pseudouridine55 synthase